MVFFMGIIEANSDILVYKIANKAHKITAQSVANGLKKEGYTVSKNQDMNAPYIKQFGSSSFHSYNLMSVYQPEFAKKLVQKDVKSGIFVPFSVAVYQKKKEDNIYIALLSATAQQRILKLHDNLFDKLEALNKSTIQKIFPQATEVQLAYKSFQNSKSFYTKYSLDVDDEDASEEYEDMMMMMKGDIKTGGFVVANYINYNEELKNEDINEYIFYHSYSLCKLQVIYELSKKTPEAGAFAPCTMIIYHKKGSNKTEIVSLNINSLISMLALKDKGLLDMLNSTQEEIVNILGESME